jgi:hypothetical protein
MSLEEPMAKERYDLSNNALSMKRAVTQMHKPGYKHSVEKRIEVISTWLALGNLRQTAAICGVSYQLCLSWKTQPWWQEMINEIQAARKFKVENKLNKIVDKALAVIDDRLDNGDFVYNQKTGEVSRKPVSLKEARGAANDLMQRQVALSKLEIETQQAARQDSVKDQIAMLAQEFAKFNTKRTVEVIPNALHEERKTGLQDGVQEVPQPGRADRESLRTELSSLHDGESGEGIEGGWEGRGSQEGSEQGWDEFDEESESDQPSEQQELFAEYERFNEESKE